MSGSNPTYLRHLPLRQALFECYREAGADTDGDVTPDAWGSDEEVARRALQAVKDLRRDYEAALDEIPHPVVQPLICSGCGRHIPCRHCPPGTPAVPDKDVCEEHGVNINNSHHRAKHHLKDV